MIIDVARTSTATQSQTRPPPPIHTHRDGYTHIKTDKQTHRQAYLDKPIYAHTHTHTLARAHSLVQNRRMGADIKE